VSPNVADPYTSEARLCDGAGMVSHERVPSDEPGAALNPNLTYRQLLDNLRRATGLPPWTGEDFICTGSMHLAGEHFRCTNPRHREAAVIHDFETVAQQHGCRVVFSTGGSWTAECSCGGWLSEPAETEHWALADHAAHVHVAAGLAVEDDDKDDAYAEFAKVLAPSAAAEVFAAGFAHAIALLRDGGAVDRWCSTGTQRYYCVSRRGFEIAADFLQAHAPKDTP
jgi:hypothetical protein